MHQLLQQIFKSKKISNTKGEIIEVHSETSEQQCGFLQEFIRRNRFRRSLEIGFAFGVSTLAIVEEIVKNGGRHCVIDKFQYSNWGGNGLDLVRQAGYGDKLDFHEEFCYKALPGLMTEGRHFDFVYIDSTKQFDWLLVDFFLIDKILDVNGIIVFDDNGFRSIRKLSRFIAQFPGYEVAAAFPENVKPGFFGRATGRLTSSTILRHIFKAGLTYRDHQLGINSRCIAFRKVDEDKRDWRWHVDF
jgi:predicted O-methyltransferase YrrM